MADRTNQILTVYDKTGKAVFTGEKGETSVAITGLAAGTEAAVGDYQVTYKDVTTNVESEKVDIPGFTVFLVPDAPVNIKSVATADGATISAE